MRRLSASKPFALDANKMEWLALLVRDTGIPASEHLGITDAVTALDFNLAVTARMKQIREDENRMQAKRIAYHASRMFFGGEDDDIPTERPTTDLLTSAYNADENTEVW